MALTWNVSAVVNCDEVCFTEVDGKRTIRATTETLIWSTMIVGLNSITEKTAMEFYTRISLYERIFGALRSVWEEGKDIPTSKPITLEEVRAHIGLGTNANNETNAAWQRRMITNYRADVQRQFRKELAPA